MMNLLAITASQNVGYIDWEPYIPIIFTRIMRSIDLPVCYKNMKSSRNQSLWPSSVASKWWDIRGIASFYLSHTMRDAVNFVRIFGVNMHDMLID